MDTKQQMLHYYRVEGLSIREIARKTKTDRKTVTRLIKAFEDAVKANPETGIDDFLAEKPKYSKRIYVAKVLKDDVSREIDKWLKEFDWDTLALNAEVSSNSISNKHMKIAEEMAGLKTYPGEIGCFEIAEYKVDKQSTICIKSNHYLVPEELVREDLPV